VRVQGCQTPVRNESDSGWTFIGHNPPASIPRENGLSVSIHVGTRKMCELCLNMVKPGETLVEARSDSDVQIDRQIWV
jgi:hypothetical protein